MSVAAGRAWGQECERADTNAELSALLVAQEKDLAKKDAKMERQRNAVSVLETKLAGLTRRPGPPLMRPCRCSPPKWDALNPAPETRLA